MNVTEDFNRAQQFLLDAEVKLRAIRNQIVGIEREIATLKAIELNLKQNMRWLKKTRIVTSLAEYRRLKEQLNTAINRQAILRIDREQALKIEKHTENVQKKAKERVDLALGKLQNPNNLIRIDFGRKDGQK